MTRSRALWVVIADASSEGASSARQPTRYLAQSSRGGGVYGWTWAPTRAVKVFTTRAEAEAAIAAMPAASAWPMEAVEQDAEAWEAACRLVQGGEG